MYEVAKLSKKAYKNSLEELQNELVNLQDWIVHKGLRVVILFEGRDAAGKGGAIKRIVKNLRDRTYKLRFPAGAGYGKVG